MVEGHLIEGQVRPTLDLILEEGKVDMVCRKDDLTKLHLISL